MTKLFGGASFINPTRAIFLTCTLGLLFTFGNFASAESLPGKSKVHESPKGKKALSILGKKRRNKPIDRVKGHKKKLDAVKTKPSQIAKKITKPTPKKQPSSRPKKRNPKAKKSKAMIKPLRAKAASKAKLLKRKTVLKAKAAPKATPKAKKAKVVLSNSPFAHAILLNGGGFPRINYYSHVLYIRMMRRVLQELGVPDQLIDIFSADGDGKGADQTIIQGRHFSDRWLFSHLREMRFFPRMHNQINTQLHKKSMQAAKRKLFKARMKKLAKKLDMSSSKKPVMLFVTDHGSRNRKNRHHRNNKISMWRESMSVTQFHKALRPFKKRRVVFVMSQCFSGSFTWSVFRKPGRFGVPLGNRCGFMATLPNQYSYGCFPETRLKKQVGHAYRFILAMRNARTFDEAHERVLLSDLTPDVPHRTSDGYLYALLQGDARADGEKPEKLVDRILRRFEGKSYPGMADDLRMISAISQRFSLTRPIHLKALFAQRKSIKKQLKWLQRVANMWRSVFRSARDHHLLAFYKNTPPLRKQVRYWSQRPSSFFRKMYRRLMKKSRSRRLFGFHGKEQSDKPCCKTDSLTGALASGRIPQSEVPPIPPPQPGQPIVPSYRVNHKDTDVARARTKAKTKLRQHKKMTPQALRRALGKLRRIFKRKELHRKWKKRRRRRRRVRRRRRRVRRRRRRVRRRRRRVRRRRRRVRRRRIPRPRNLWSSMRTVRTLRKGFITYIHSRPRLLKRLQVLRQKEKQVRHHLFWVKTQIAALQRMEMLFYRVAGRLLLEHDKHPDFRAYRVGLNYLISCEKTPITRDAMIASKKKFVPLSFSTKGLPLPSWFGISFRSLKGKNAPALPKGAIEVDAVYLNTPAKHAGLRPGDKVVSVNHEQLREPFEIRERVMLSSSKKATPMMVLRNGRLLELQVQLRRLTRPPALKLAPIIGRSYSNISPGRLLSNNKLAPNIRSGVSLLFFWATWCGPCKIMLPDMRRWKQRYGKKGLRVFTISNEAPKVIRKWLRSHPNALPFMNLYDPSRTLFRRFRIQGTPTIFVLKNGKVVFKHVGFLKLKRLERAIQQQF